MTKIWAYVFVDTENPGPKRVVRAIRRLPGVVRADTLLGTPDIIAIVEGAISPTAAKARAVQWVVGARLCRLHASPQE